MQVYRIETACGEGPFGASMAVWAYNTENLMGGNCFSPPGAHDEAPETELHQFYKESGGGCMPDYIRFGFESIDQLENWFRCTSGRRAMQHCGVNIQVYDVPEEYVMRGNWQVIFNKKQAVWVRSVDLVTLEE